MKIKHSYLAIVAVLLANAATAQDKMYKTNGDVIDAKVKSVNENVITYKRFNNPDGPDYQIKKAELSRIKYANGTEEEYNVRMQTSSAAPRSKPKYGKNILTFSPMTLSNVGIGVGLGYERILDKDGKFAFVLPISYFYNNLSGDYDPYPYNGGNSSQAINFLAVAPGIKIYPTGFGVVRYGIGASLAFGTGTTRSYEYNPLTGYNSYVSNDRFVMGFMVNNSLNINPTPKVYLGLEMGMGTTYVNQVNGIEGNVAFLVQFGIKGGFRF